MVNKHKLTPKQVNELGSSRKLLTEILTKQQLEALRKKPLGERNFIIQSKLNELENKRRKK